MKETKMMATMIENMTNGSWTVISAQGVRLGTYPNAREASAEVRRLRKGGK